MRLHFMKCALEQLQLRFPFPIPLVIASRFDFDPLQVEVMVAFQNLPLSLLFQYRIESRLSKTSVQLGRPDSVLNS